MINLLAETLEAIEEYSEISWAKIITYQDKEYILPPKHTTDERNNFFRSLNFKYDNGYGSQEVFGVIVFTDGTWLERWEYDGAEGWAYRSCPDFESYKY
jgi:hypothetical protein